MKNETIPLCKPALTAIANSYHRQYIKIEGKAMIRNLYNYPTPPIRDIKGKETQTQNN